MIEPGERIHAGNDQVGDDQAQFAAWVEPWWEHMARFARATAPTDAWEDVLQEALLVAWRKRKQYDVQRGSPRAWLLAIVADRVRKEARRRSPRVEFLPIDNPANWNASYHDLRQALAQLPARRRVAVELYYFRGLSLSETAQVMNCSPGTVKATLSAARRQLRDPLETASRHEEN